MTRAVTKGDRKSSRAAAVSSQRLRASPNWEKALGVVRATRQGELKAGGSIDGTEVRIDERPAKSGDTTRDRKRSVPKVLLVLAVGPSPLEARVRARVIIGIL
jgi:hypothetical protein